jgi:hypothetical protein
MWGERRREGSRGQPIVIEDQRAMLHRKYIALDEKEISSSLDWDVSELSRDRCEKSEYAVN